MRKLSFCIMNLYITLCWPTLADFYAKSSFHGQGTYRMSHHDHMKNCKYANDPTKEKACIYRVSYGQMGQRNHTHSTHYRIHALRSSTVHNRLHHFSLKIQQQPITLKDFTAMRCRKKRTPNWLFTLHEEKYTDNFMFNALEDLLSLYLLKNTPMGTSCLSITRFFRKTNRCTSVQRIFLYDSLINKANINSHRIPELLWNHEIYHFWQPFMKESVLFIFDPRLPGLMNLFNQRLYHDPTRHAIDL